MRLAEAMRLGSMMVPQTTMRWFGYDPPPTFDGDRSVVAACAMGAVLLAAGKEKLFRGSPGLDLDWLLEGIIDAADVELLSAIVVCPACRAGDALLDQRMRVGGQLVTLPFSHYMLPVRDVVIVLNDHHGWSREAIADWIESVAAKPVEEPVAVTEPELVAVHVRVSADEEGA